jgi:hypothetical protein
MVLTLRRGRDSTTDRTWNRTVFLTWPRSLTPANTLLATNCRDSREDFISTLVTEVEKVG